MTFKEKKIALLKELENQRAAFSGNFRNARHDLNPASQLRAAITHRKIGWLAGAVVAGWVISRLPGKKKGVVGKVSSLVKTGGFLLRNGGKLGVLLTAGKGIFGVAKPALTHLVSRKLEAWAQGVAPVAPQPPPQKPPQ